MEHWQITISGFVDGTDAAKHGVIRRLARAFADICQSLDIGVSIAVVDTPTGDGALPPSNGLLITGTGLYTNPDPNVGGTPTTNPPGKPK